MNMLDGYVYGATFANYQLRLFMLPQARDESSYSEKNLFFMYFLKRKHFTKGNDIIDRFFDM